MNCKQIHLYAFKLNKTLLETFQPMLCYAMPGDNFFLIHMPCDLLPVRFLKQVEGSLVRYEITCGQHITRWIRSMVFTTS